MCLVDVVGEAPFFPIALVAVGGYGRRGSSAHSDLDLLLAARHPRGVADVAERALVPDLGRQAEARSRGPHGQRSAVPGRRRPRHGHLAAVRAAISPVPELTERSQRAKCSGSAPSRRGSLAARRRRARRHAEYGEVAFLLEPNLKEGRGGAARRARPRLGRAAAARAAARRPRGAAPCLRRPARALVELHADRPAPRRLRLDEQDAVAAALGDRNADVLMARIAAAARTIAWTSDETWRRIARHRRPGGPRVPPRSSARPWRAAPRRRGAPRREVRPRRPIPPPCLRVAVAAARTGLAIQRGRSTASPPARPTFPDRGPPAPPTSCARCCSSGRAPSTVLEALDQRGLMVKLLPEWKAVRNRPAAQRPAPLHRRPPPVGGGRPGGRPRRPGRRPDLLVLARCSTISARASGRPQRGRRRRSIRPHRASPRAGAADVAISATLVRHHLLLPDVATRRDLSDPDTTAAVVAAVGDAAVLDLLAALTEADGRATGPAAWSDWKAWLIAELVERVHELLAGQPPTEPRWAPFPPVPGGGPDGRAAAGGSRSTPDPVTVVDANQPGIVARIAGVLQPPRPRAYSRPGSTPTATWPPSEMRLSPPSGGAAVRWEQVVAPTWPPPSTVASRWRLAWPNGP